MRWRGLVARHGARRAGSQGDGAGRLGERSVIRRLPSTGRQRELGFSFFNGGLASDNRVLPLHLACHDVYFQYILRVVLLLPLVAKNLALEMVC